MVAMAVRELSAGEVHSQRRARMVVMVVMAAVFISWRIPGSIPW